MTKNLFTFYSLESPTKEGENLNKRLVISPSKKNICRGQEAVLHLQKLSGSNAYNCGGFTRCSEEGARRKLLDRMNVFFRRSSFMKLQQGLTLK